MVGIFPKILWHCLLFYFIGGNIILVPIFWCHSQFGPYILRAVNLVPTIFKSQSI